MIAPATLSRRRLLAGLGAAALKAQQSRPKVAAIVTEFRHRSHADVICTRILDGYFPDGRRQQPRTRIVSMYTDQVPADDMSRAFAYRKRFTIYPTIEEALTLGGDQLAVDAVLLIGEHGDYPVNERGQKLYPRHRLFEEIIEVLRASGRSVPLFCDKHLSYSWDKARQMYDWALELKVSFMAGSSIPVTVRTPELEIPSGATITRRSRPATALSIRTGFTPWNRSSAWSSGDWAERAELRPSRCLREMRSGNGAMVPAGGRDPCWRKQSHGIRGTRREPWRTGAATRLSSS